MLFENQLDITIRAFFFNAKTDYLPYYKNFSFTVKKEDTLKDILAMIKEKNSMFAYPEKDLIFRVNGMVVTGVEKISDVVEKLGVELKIEPALEYRSDNGLILNNHDFMHQYRRVFTRHNTTKEDLAYYLTLYPHHYASETFNYNREYIGDAILILAHKMINDKHHNVEEILKDINDEFNGINCCEYENNLFNGEDYSKIIDELKDMIKASKNKCILDKIKKTCLNKMRTSIEIDSLDGKNVALYVGDKNPIEIDVEFIKFDMSTKKAGQSLMETYPTIAYQKAGKMLLQAFDSGVEVLVFAKDEDLALFTDKISQIESEVGREISMAFISLSRFKELSAKVEA